MFRLGWVAIACAGVRRAGASGRRRPVGRRCVKGAPLGDREAACAARKAHDLRVLIALLAARGGGGLILLVLIVVAVVLLIRRRRPAGPPRRP